MELEIENVNDLDEAKELLSFLWSKGLKPRWLVRDDSVEQLVPIHVAKPPMRGWIIFLWKDVTILDARLPTSFFVVKTKDGRRIWFISKFFIKNGGKKMRARWGNIKGWVRVPKIIPKRTYQTHPSYNFIPCEDFEVIIS